MSQLRDSGVYFRNSYSVFPTFTGCNASAMATGHYLGDSGGFRDWIYGGFRVASFASSVVVALDQNPVLVELDRHFGGNFLKEETVLKAARDRGFSTAAIGKLGAALMFDHTEDGRGHTIVVDDSTGRPNGIALPPDVVDAFGRCAADARLCERPVRRRRPGIYSWDSPDERDQPRWQSRYAEAEHRGEFQILLHGRHGALMSTAVVSDTELQQGQGMHGSFSRSETLTFMAAIGPDFKRGDIDDLPVSNVESAGRSPIS
jgi:hypothetical protein